MHVSKHIIGSFIFYLITVSQLINYIYYNHSFFRNIQRYFFFPIFTYYALFIYLFIYLPPFHFSLDRSSFLLLIPKLFFPILFLWWLLAFNLRPKLISTYVY